MKASASANRCVRLLDTSSTAYPMGLDSLDYFCLLAHSPILLTRDSPDHSISDFCGCSRYHSESELSARCSTDTHGRSRIESNGRTTTRTEKQVGWKMVSAGHSNGRPNHELVGTAHPKRAIRPTALTLGHSTHHANHLHRSLWSDARRRLGLFRVFWRLQSLRDVSRPKGPEGCRDTFRPDALGRTSRVGVCHC